MQLHASLQVGLAVENFISTDIFNPMPIDKSYGNKTINPLFFQNKFKQFPFAKYFWLDIYCNCYYHPSKILY